MVDGCTVAAGQEVLHNDHSQNVGVRVDVDVGVGELVDTEMVDTEVVDTEAGTDVVDTEAAEYNYNLHARSDYSW